MKVHITVNDMRHFDDLMELAKGAIQGRGSKKSGKIILTEPHVDLLPHGGAEFDGETTNYHIIGSWRIGKS